MTPDLQRLVDTATAFFLAGERCSLELKFGRYDFHDVNAPTITNYAFSVELALKALYYIVDETLPKGHDLRGLVEGLPSEIQSNLPYLTECAGRIRRDFEDWRYPHEHGFLIASSDDARRSFIEAYNEIRRLRPKLMSVYEANWGAFEPVWLDVWCDGASIQSRFN